MIIHNPIVSGSLTFADNATLTSALSTITGSFRGDILSTNGLVSSSAQVITLLPDGIVSGSSQLIGILPDGVVSGSTQVVDLLPTGVISGSSQLDGENLDLGIVSASQFRNTGITLLQGDVYIGSGFDDDSIYFDGIIQSDLIPRTGSLLPGLKNLGSSTHPWSSIYVRNIISDGGGIISSSDQLYDSLQSQGGGGSLVSSSAQISAYNTFLEINGMGIISSSDQVNADTIQQFDANVEDVLNADGVISGSSQVIASDTFNFDTAVTDVMNGATVVSGSDQVTSSLDNRYVNVTGNETVAGNKTFTNNVTISGNLTVDGTTTTTSTNNVIVGDNIIDLNYGGGATDGGLYVTDVTVSGLETGSLLWDGVQNRWVAGVKNSEIKILLADSDGIISSSDQLVNTFLEINGDNVVSSSTQISNYGVFAELNGGNLVSSSQQISNYGVFAELNGGGLISSSEQLTSTFLEVNGDNVISSSEQLTSTFLEINGDNVISASSQVVLNDANKTGFDTDDVSEGSNLYYTDTRVKTKLDNDSVISGSDQVDGTSISNNSITIAGTSTSLGGSITYNTITAGTGTISGSSQLDGTTIGSTTPSIFSGSFSGSFVGDGSQLSGVTSYTDADTLAYINSQNVVSSSIQVDVTSTTGYGSINQYSDSKVKTYLDSQTVISGSSQITITESQISDLTHYTDSDVKTKLNAEGVYSSSAQIEGNFLEVDGDNVVSSSAQISSYNVFLEKNGDGVVSGSGQLSNVFLSKDGDGVVSGSTQLQGDYDLRYLQINGDNVISGASQLYTDLDARYGNEDGEGLISSSAQIQGFGIFAELNGDGLISSSGQLTDTFLEINGDNVISGSAQVVSSLVSATGISSGNKTTIQTNLGVDAAGTDNSTDVTLAGSYDYLTLSGQQITLGQVDASTDISNLTTTNVSEATNLYYTDARVKTKLNAEGVYSSSAQITITESQISDLTHYTDSDFDTRLATKSTTNLSEGTNLYYTDARVKTKLNTEGVVSGSSQISLSGFDTDDISEGSSNLYYTDTRVRDYIRSIDVISGSATQVRTFLNVEDGADVTDAANVTSGLVAATGISSGNKTTIQTNLGVDAAGTDNSTDVTLAGSYDYITISGQVITRNQVDASTDISNLNTDNVSEGSTNKYASTANVKTALNANLGTLTLGDSDDTVSIPGNLTVSGTTNFIDSNTLNIGDNNIVLNADVTGTPSQNGGITIERGTSTNATLIWDESNDYWVAGLAGSEERIVIGAGNTSITTLGTITTGTWNGSVIASAYLDADTAHLSGTQTFSGAKTFSAAVNISNSTASTTKTTGALIVTGGVGISGALNVGGDVVAYASSDERLKDNIELISNPIEKVQSLKGVTWNWNENADELQQSLPNVGVIAQDVEKVLPQLVTDRDNGFKGVDYAKLTGLLIEAIKEQQKQIDELKSKIK